MDGHGVLGAGVPYELRFRHSSSLGVVGGELAQKSEQSHTCRTATGWESAADCSPLSAGPAAGADRSLVEYDSSGGERAGTDISE